MLQLSPQHVDDLVRVALQQLLPARDPGTLQDRRVDRADPEQQRQILVALGDAGHFVLAEAGADAAAADARPHAFHARPAHVEDQLPCLLQSLGADLDLDPLVPAVPAQLQETARLVDHARAVWLQQQPIERKLQLVGRLHVLVRLDLDRQQCPGRGFDPVRAAADAQLLVLEVRRPQQRQLRIEQAGKALLGKLDRDRLPLDLDMELAPGPDELQLELVHRVLEADLAAVLRSHQAYGQRR